MKSVDFNIPEGADPMGIGILDLGKSSYDPIETIQRFNENRRQNRLIRDERRREDYRYYMDRLPTAQGTNQQISSNLNKDVAELSELFLQQQSMGGWGGLAKTDDGEKVRAKMARLENKIATDIPIYNNYSIAAEKDKAVMRDPAKAKNLDMEATMRNFDAMQSAKTVEEFARPFTENGGSLLVYKPTPVKMMAEVTARLADYLPEEEVLSYQASWDPATNKFKTEETTGIDPAKLERAMLNVYDDMMDEEDEFATDIDSRYRNAPKSQTETEDGLTIDKKAWFVGRYVPGYENKIKTGYVAKGTDKDKEETPEPTGLEYAVAREDDGTIDLPKMADTIKMKTPVEATTKKVLRTKRSGQKVYDKPTTETQSVDADYSTVSVPLTGFNKTFEMYNHASAIDTSTGKRPDETSSSTHKAVRMDFIPVWRGKERNIYVEETDEDGNAVTKVWNLKPGDKIPIHVQEKLQEEGETFSYEPFLMTSNIFGAAIEQRAQAAGLTWEEYVSRHGLTTITPWEKANRELLTKMKAEGYDPAEILKVIEEIDRKLNGIDDMFK